MDDYQKAQKEFYSLYTPLRKKYNLRLHIHFGLYEDGLIEIWEYEGEREKRLICKAAEDFNPHSHTGSDSKITEFIGNFAL